MGNCIFNSSVYMGKEIFMFVLGLHICVKCELIATGRVRKGIGRDFTAVPLRARGVATKLTCQRVLKEPTIP